MPLTPLYTSCKFKRLWWASIKCLANTSDEFQLVLVLELLVWCDRALYVRRLGGIDGSFGKRSCV
jgi:hypothetical protein